MTFLAICYSNILRIFITFYHQYQTPILYIYKNLDMASNFWGVLFLKSFCASFLPFTNMIFNDLIEASC